MSIITKIFYLHEIADPVVNNSVVPLLHLNKFWQIFENLARGFHLTLTLCIPYRKNKHFSHSKYFLCPFFKQLYFSKMEKKNISCSANKSDHKREIWKMKLLWICIKWKIQTEDMPLSLCFLSFMILQCVEREMWWREKQQEADLGWWKVCLLSSSSVSEIRSSESLLFLYVYF